MTVDVLPAGLSTTEYADIAARMAALRQLFHACVEAATTAGGSADAIAAAIMENLGATTATALPQAAQTVWRERVARPLKADSTKPLPARAIGSIRSWPSARLARLAAALSEIEALLATAENEARNELIYAEISRAYS